MSAKDVENLGYSLGFVPESETGGAGDIEGSVLEHLRLRFVCRSCNRFFVRRPKLGLCPDCESPLKDESEAVMGFVMERGNLQQVCGRSTSRTLALQTLCDHRGVFRNLEKFCSLSGACKPSVKFLIDKGVIHKCKVNGANIIHFRREWVDKAVRTVSGW